MVELFGRGLLIGLAIAAPVGPIGILCIRRTLSDGRWAGFVSGMGAATADGIYGCVAGFGLTFVSAFLMDHALWLKMIGGLFLCYLGIKTLRSEAAQEPAAAKSHGFLGMYFSTLALTITNPATILSFMAVFAGLGLATAAGDYLKAIALVIGVFGGSAIWWLILSSGANLLRGKLARRLTWINRLSGGVLIAFGLFALKW